MLDGVGKLLTKRCFERPILVTGTPRSGTTALAGGLSKHPHVLGARVEHPLASYVGEIPFMYEFHSNRPWLLKSLAVSKPYLYQQLRRIVFEGALGRHHGVKTLAIRLARGDRHICSKRRWCAKSYFSFERFQGISQLYPQARFVDIVRNGSDVVLSRMRFPSFTSQPFEQHCRIWAEAVTSSRYVLDAHTCMRVRQEDLIADPERVFDQLCDFVGLPRDPSPARFLRCTLIHPHGEPTRHGVDVRRAVAARPPAHTDWSSAQKQTFERICGKAMVEAGYAMPF